MSRLLGPVRQKPGIGLVAAYVRQPAGGFGQVEEFFLELRGLERDLGTALW